MCISRCKRISLMTRTSATNFLKNIIERIYRIGVRGGCGVFVRIHIEKVRITCRAGAIKQIAKPTYVCDRLGLGGRWCGFWILDLRNVELPLLLVSFQCSYKGTYFMAATSPAGSLHRSTLLASTRAYPSPRPSPLPKHTTHIRLSFAYICS